MEDQTLPYFEWTPGGLHLLEVINKIIQDNGGIEIMRELVSMELSEDTYQIDKRKMEAGFKHAMRFKINNDVMADLLGMGYHDYIKKKLSFINSMQKAEVISLAPV